MDRNELIKQLEKNCQEILVKMEGFNKLQEEYSILSRSLKVLRGERLGSGRRPQGESTENGQPDSKNGQPDSRGVGVVNSPLILAGLIKFPKSSPKELAEKMGHVDIVLRRRIGVILAYLCQRKMVSKIRDKDGNPAYEVNAKGREYLAQNIERGENG